MLTDEIWSLHPHADATAFQEQKRGKGRWPTAKLTLREAETQNEESRVEEEET